MYIAKNPILPGFSPDPSICRVGEDYYIVNSSFAYFPGVPIYHSRDLAHWEQIGNVLERESQLPLEGCGHSDGIYAPTLRYYNGTFYMITTNISGGGNFLVTAENPQGPWSEPYYLGEAAQGIDPSLFFDEDGKCYYVGTRPNQSGVRYNGDWEIWLQELDLEKMKLTGESKKIWKGAVHHAIWPEGPHLYKKDGWYYLIHAEGGTAMEHAISAARSRELWGPYEGCKRNPIFTHRNLGAAYPVVAAGHGDLVEDGHGNWYIVMIAARRWEGYGNTGRDTYLAKVSWEEDWPVINPGLGRLEDAVELPGEPERQISPAQSWHFYGKKLPHCFMALRNPKTERYTLTEREGSLRIYAGKETLTDRESPSYVCLRQQEYEFRLAALMEFFEGEETEEAGIAVMCNEENHLRLVKTYREKKPWISLISCQKGKTEVVAEQSIAEGRAELIMISRGQETDWYIQVEEQETCTVAQGVDMRGFSTEATGGFTGCTLGMYVSANRKESSHFADFLHFSCEGISYSEY